MIDLVFTLDYELYGDGTGSLERHVFEPGTRINAVFQKWRTPFVVFVEAAEFEMIESEKSDKTIIRIKEQIRDYYNNGVEIGLHLHPQWYGGKHKNGKWVLNQNEYNLCTLSETKINSYIERSIAYIRETIGDPNFTPLVFRAGNWLFQPTRIVAEALLAHGIKVDSSVYKGGRQRQYGLNYRRALGNGYYWTFRGCVELPDPEGTMIELPVYTQMVPFWRMATPKRISIQRKGPNQAVQVASKNFLGLLDRARFRYPLKLDYCRLTSAELRRMTDVLVLEDKKNSEVYRPVVAIGHSKDLVDLDTVDAYLGYVRDRGIHVSTFLEVYAQCQNR